MKNKIFMAMFIIMTAVLLVSCGQAENVQENEGEALQEENTSTWQEQLNLGLRYLEEGNYEEAIVAFTAAIEIDPKQAAAYVGRGDAYIGSGETEENLSMALSDYEMAVEIDSMSVDAYLGIIEVYIRTGEYDLALEQAEKGYELTGDEQLAEKAEMIKSGNISRWDGQLVKMTRFDTDGNVSWWHEYTYDRENRQDSISHYGADGNLIKTLPLTYDEDGNRLESYISITDTGELHRKVYSYENRAYVSWAWYESDDTTIESWEVYENDAEGKEIRSTRGRGSHIGDETEIYEYTETEYDEDGNVIKCSGYDTDYKLNWYYILEYDATGRGQKCSEYDADGSLNWYAIYEYDEEGKMKSEKHYNGSGELEYENTYE